MTYPTRVLKTLASMSEAHDAALDAIPENAFPDKLIFNLSATWCGEKIADYFEEGWNFNSPHREAVQAPSADTQTAPASRAPMNATKAWALMESMDSTTIIGFLLDRHGVDDLVDDVHSQYEANNA